MYISFYSTKMLITMLKVLKRLFTYTDTHENFTHFFENLCYFVLSTLKSFFVTHINLITNCINGVSSTVKEI